MITRGFTGAVLVVIGGLFVSTLPEFSVFSEIEILQAMRALQTGRMAGLLVVMVGLGMLGAAWLSMSRRVARADTEDEQNAAMVLVRQATVLWCLPFVFAPPMFSRDGWSYAAQSVITRLDLSPYVHGPGILTGPIIQGVDPQWMTTPTPYGPLPLILGDLAAGVTDNPWMLVVAHRLYALAGIAMIAWAVPQLARWCGTNPALVTAIVIASPMMLANGVAGLHNDVLMVGLMCVALVVARTHGWVLAAVLGGAAAAVKIPGGLICIPIALMTLPVAAPFLHRVRRLAGTAAVSLATLSGMGLVWGLGIGWLDALSVPGKINTPLSATTVLGGLLDDAAGALGLGLGPATFVDMFRAFGTVAMVLFAAWVALRGRTGSPVGAIQQTALITGVTLLLLPVVHIWYVLWVVPFVAPLKLSRLAMSAVVATGLIIGLVAPLDSSLHGAYLVILFGCLAVALLTPLLLLTAKSRERLERIADNEWIPVP